MKKLIALATLFLAFTINANAQDKKQVSSSEAAAKDVAALTAKVKINDNLQKDIYTLMIMKYDELQNPQMTAEAKANMGKKIERKIMSALDENQRKELNKYPEVLQQLTH